MSLTVARERVGVVRRDTPAKRLARVDLSGTLEIGDVIRFESPDSDANGFTQAVTRLAVDGEPCERASERTNGAIEILVVQGVRRHDVIYKILIAPNPISPVSPTQPPPVIDGGNEGPKKGRGGGTGTPSTTSSKRKKPGGEEPNEDDDDNGEDTPSLPDPSDFPPAPRKKKKGRGVGG